MRLHAARSLVNGDLAVGELRLITIAAKSLDTKVQVRSILSANQFAYETQPFIA